MANKTLYHSELTKLGPVTVTVKSEPAKSKFNNKPNYVLLSVGGTDRIYNVENPNCEAFFKGQSGRTMVIEAHGSRDDASFKFIGDAADDTGQEQEPPAQQQRASAPPARQSPPPQSTPPPKSTPPPARSDYLPKEGEQTHEASVNKPPAETPEARLNRVKSLSRKIGNIQLVAYRATLDVRAAIRRDHGRDIPDVLFDAFVMNNTIQLEKAGMEHTIPGTNLSFPTVEPSDNDGAAE